MTDKARELLERIRPWSMYLPLNLRGEILDFLSTPEPEHDEEPVAFKLHPRYEDEDGYFDFTDNEETANQLKDRGWTIEPLYLHPAPRKPFVRLSEEKMKRLINENLESLSFYEIARAIEDALERANSSTIPLLNDTISTDSRDLGHE